MEETLIMGLDISTSHIGVCIATKDDQIKLFSAIDYSKLGDLTIFDKTKLFRMKMMDVFEEYNIKTVYIEQPLLMFKQASSRIQVIVLLQQFNALCQFVLNEMGKKVVMIPSSTAMKAGLGIGRKPKWVEDKKVWTSEEFHKLHPEIELKRYEKGKKEGQIHSDEYDKVDAWMCSRAHVLGK